ncbi:MAG: PH domain-containing protein [Nocardioides sp.]|nr:PH domain-containing protein [Nocardioides sp.]
MSTLFAPPGTEWTSVSPRLTSARRVALVLGLTPLAAGLALLVVLAPFLPRWVYAVALGAVVAFLVFWWFWIAVLVRRWRYAERDEDLYVRNGALFRTLVAVPYGRMQYVDVSSGPVDRHFGIATISLHTAAPGTSAVIPGLPADEAARLRDRLTELGGAQGSGL